MMSTIMSTDSIWILTNCVIRWGEGKILIFSDFYSPGKLCCLNTTLWHGTILFYMKYYKQEKEVIMNLSANLSRNAENFAHHLFIYHFIFKAVG